MRHVSMDILLLCACLLLPHISCAEETEFGLYKVGKNLPKYISRRVDHLWQLYKARNNKTYTCKEESKRRSAWKRNLLTIYEHNLLAKAGRHTYTLTDNYLADLSTCEYQKKMTKLLPSRRKKLCEQPSPIVGAVHFDRNNISRAFDWRKKGFKTSAVDQQTCGSCYAYSLALSIQGQVLKKYNKLLPLSAQQIVDCSRVTGNLGCSGGSLRNTLAYLQRSKGLMKQNAYPYKAKEGPCKFQEDLRVVNISTWAVLPVGDEQALEVAVATIGPIAVSINASPKTFQLYDRGIYDDPLCSSKSVNHAMLLVGYTSNEWILKNWWGDKWGEDGYMRLAKNKNRCGITNYAAYAIVA